MNRFWACLWGVWMGIVYEFYRFLEKILTSLVKTKQKRSRKRRFGHQFIAFFMEPHSFGLCKAWVEGVMADKTIRHLPGCIPAI